MAFEVTEQQAASLNAATLAELGPGPRFAHLRDGRWVVEPRSVEMLRYPRKHEDPEKAGAFLDLDAIVAVAGFADYAALGLEEAKESKREAVRARTETLILEGFMFKGERMSMSMAAQANYTGLLAMRESMAYPLPPWMNRDDTAAIIIESAEEVEQLAGAVTQHIASIRFAGNDLMIAINAAATAEDLEQIKDTRGA